VLAYPWFFIFGSLLVWRHRRGILHVTGAIVANRADVATVHLCHSAHAEQKSPRRSSRRSPAYVANAVAARWLSRVGESWCYRPGRLHSIVGVSRGVGNELRRCFPALADRITVIPNAVDQEAFTPAAVDPNKAERLTALFVGSEWEGKGLRFAIEALARAPDWQLLILGRGDQSRYEELARSVGAVDRVRFVTPTPDILPIYQAANAFLLPSAYESFSLATHEAAACGLPLLVTQVSGVEDLLEDGTNGWFIDQDAGDIALRLQALAADPSLRVSMGAAARVASTAYSWEEMARAYSELYERIATDRTAQSEPAGAPV
jgi:glycosyltransferase involved in cell wall biosynthesis